MTSRPVVAAIDASTTTEAVVRAAADAARRHRQELIVVHVVDRWQAAHDVGEDPLLVRCRAEVATSHPDVATTTEHLRGHPVDALVDRSGSSTLVVMGTSRRHGVAETLLGSTTTGVLRHAACPVLVVPPTPPAPDPDRPVVAAVELDHDDSALLAAALAEAAARGCDLRVVHSCRGGEVLATFGPGAPVAYDNMELRARLEINRLLAAQAPVHAGVRTTVVVSPAPPAKLLPTVAQDASLVVLGRRPPHVAPHSPWHVTRNLLHHTSTPVLVVPSTAPERVHATHPAGQTVAESTA